MSDRWLDDLTRLLAVNAPRRAALAAIGATGALTAFTTRGVEAGAGCKKLRRRCRKNRQCCTLKCRRGRCRR